jgi:hypothetical protein
MTFGSLHDVEVLCRNVGGLDVHIHILCVKKLCAASAVISVKGVDSYNEVLFRAWSDVAAGPPARICIVLATSVSRQYKTYTGMTASATGSAKLVTSIVYTASSAWANEKQHQIHTSMRNQGYVRRVRCPADGNLGKRSNFAQQREDWR